MDFIPSESSTIGMEMEFQLLDANTLDLVDGILPLIELYPDSTYIKPEFIQNTVEVASRVCHNLEELHTHVLSLVSDLKTKCNALGMELCGAGTHPFCKRLALITPKPRYLRMEQETGYLGHNQITFATHVHIGMSSGDQAISLMSRLTPCLPLLIALSASSPFWRGYDTEYVAYRHRILAASKSYGIPPYFSDWQEFSDFFDMSHRANIFETINDIHWDIRPRPHLGSLEIRVMDAQPTVSHAIILSGFVYYLAKYFLHTIGEGPLACMPSPLPWWIEKENHYQATRLGLSANYILDNKGAVTTLRALLKTVMDTIRPFTKQIGGSDYLDQLAGMIDGGLSYHFLHQAYHKSGSMKHVVSALVHELEMETNMVIDPASS